MRALAWQAISSYEAPPYGSPLSAALSPLLGIALLWCLRRFVSTYLMPDEATCSVLAPPYLALWGADTQGAAALVQLCVDAAARVIVEEEEGRDIREQQLEEDSVLHGVAQVGGVRQRELEGKEHEHAADDAKPDLHARLGEDEVD